MDRLSTLKVVLGAMSLATAACGDQGGSGSAPPPRSRVNAVEAEAPAEVDLAGFCERQHPAESAPVLSLPPLAGDSPAAPTGKKRWINVWATWCKPCIEELPRLTEWRDELAPRSDFDLVFLSADADAETVRTFTKDHPEVEGSLRLDSADAVDPWVKEMGLPGSAVLPVHVFVDAHDRVRCLRSAGIGKDDRAAVEQLLVSM